VVQCFENLDFQIVRVLENVSEYVSLCRSERKGIVRTSEKFLGEGDAAQVRQDRCRPSDECPHAYHAGIQISDVRERSERGVDGYGALEICHAERDVQHVCVFGRQIPDDETFRMYR
jgi:hypothetical protein